MKPDDRPAVTADPGSRPRRASPYPTSSSESTIYPMWWQHGIAGIAGLNPGNCPPEPPLTSRESQRVLPTVEVHQHLFTAPVAMGETRLRRDRIAEDRRGVDYLFRLGAGLASHRH